MCRFIFTLLVTKRNKLWFKQLFFRDLKKAQEKIQEQENEMTCLKNEIKTLRDQVNGSCKCHFWLI